MDKDATKLDELTNDQIRLRLAEFGYEKKIPLFFNNYFLLYFKKRNFEPLPGSN